MTDTQARYLGEHDNAPQPRGKQEWMEVIRDQISHLTGPLATALGGTPDTNPKFDSRYETGSDKSLLRAREMSEDWATKRDAYTAAHPEVLEDQA